MKTKTAEILLASVIVARASSLLLSRFALQSLTVMQLLSCRFLLAFLILSLALSLLFFGAIRGIGWGTLVLTLLNGPIIGFFDRMIAAHVDTPALFPKLEERFRLN